MTFTTVPASIDNTGKTDVSVALTEYLDDLKQGHKQARLRRQSSTVPGRYRVDAGLFVAPNVDLDLNGCQVATPEGTGESVTCPAGPWREQLDRMWPRSRATVHLGSGASLFSGRVGARVHGGARTPSYLGDWAIGCKYDARFEAQHALRVIGDNTKVDLSRVELAWAYGDGIYVEWWVDDTEIAGRWNTEIAGRWNITSARDSLGGHVERGRWKVGAIARPGIHHTARQGIAQSGGKNIHVHDVGIWQVARSLFDFEPGAGGTMDGVLLERVLSGIFQNTWIASKGNGYVHNLTAQGCRNLHKSLSVYCTEWQGSKRRKNWAILDNVADRKAFWSSPLALMRFSRVDNAVIAGNRQPIDHRQAGRATYFDDCTGVDVVDKETQFPLV